MLREFLFMFMIYGAVRFYTSVALVAWVCQAWAKKRAQALFRGAFVSNIDLRKRGGKKKTYIPIDSY